MQEPKTPEDEPDRLAALARYSVVDTPLERCFDQLTQLAAHILGTPMALVSLVDANRQWFKSRYGLAVEQTPRSVSFCGHVVADRKPLVVADTSLDPRFEDNPLVCGFPNIAFYAGAPLTTPDGHVLGTLCVLDTEPRKPTEEQLRMLHLLAGQVVEHLEARRERRRVVQYRRLFDSPLLLPLILEPDGTIREHNQAWLGFGAERRETLRGTSVLDLVDIADVAAFKSQLARVRAGADPEPLRTRVPTRNGARCLEWTAHFDEVELWFYLLARDITAEQALEREKRQMVSMVSHDLRTPLTSINGSLKLLDSGRMGPLTEDAAGLVTIAANACDRLIRLVGTLLDLDRVDSGREGLHLEIQPLVELLEAARNSVAGYAEERDVPLAMVHPSTQLEVDGDRIVQVLTNLLSNAIRHSPQGREVRIDVTQISDAVRIEVIDQGEGISEEEQRRLFRRFSQLGPHRSEGSGLGLAVSKALVEAHGGTIGVQSTPGEGATFWFEVPRRQVRPLL